MSIRSAFNGTSLAVGILLSVGLGACAPAAPAAPTAPPAAATAGANVSGTAAAAAPTAAAAAKPVATAAAQAAPTLAAAAATGVASVAGPIKIGMFAPISGDAAAQGKSAKDGLDMAVDEANSGGGVLGQQVQATAEDDAGKPEQAVSICTRFVSQDKVTVVIGGISSPTSLACSEVTEKARVPQIITGGTAARITQRGDKYIFRIPVPDTNLGGDVARFANKQGWMKIAFLHVNDDFGNGGVQAVKDAMAKLGGMEAVDDESYTRGDKDFTAQLTKIKQARPDALVEWSRYAEGALIAQQIQDLGMGSIPHIGSDGFSQPQYIDLGGAAVEGVYYTAHWDISNPDPTSKAWVDAFQKKFNRPPDPFNAQTYTAVKVGLDAIKRAGTTDTDKVRDAIAATKDLPTPMGAISFNDNGDPNYPTFMMQVKDGKPTVVQGRG